MNRGLTNPDKERCLDWIYNKKSEVESASYGKNKRAVSDSIALHEERSRQVQNYEKTVDKTQKSASGEDADHLQQSYEGLKDTLDKKLNCLQTMLEITSLEDSCGSLSAEFDTKAVHLVTSGREQQLATTGSAEQLPGFNSPSSRDCIFATRDNWDWILTLVDCTKIHLTNAAEYHQFFHEIDESAPWLLEDLKRVAVTFDVHKFKGDYDDAKRLLQELEDMGRILRQWDAKTQHLWERAMKVVPVDLRTEGIKVETPCRAIADYETKEIHVRRGEDLLLLDNTRATMWVVKNSRGQEAEIPAVCVLIPGPTKAALAAAIRLRFQLLAAWTNVLKRIGKRLLCFMLLVFKPVYDEDEIRLLRTTRNIEKADLLRILDYIESSLRTHWSEHEAFIALQERVLALRMILEEATETSMDDEGVYKALVVQVTMLEQLMRKYRDLWTQWEAHKVSVEASRSPELMLMVDKWEQLQFVSRAYMAKFWQTELKFDDFERSLASLQGMVADGVDGLQGPQGSEGQGEGSFGYGEQTEVTQVVEETVQAIRSNKLERVESIYEETDFGMAHETTTAETEQLSSAEMEEKKTFFIRAVLDPRTNQEVSMDDAIMAGIMKPAEGVYYNPVTSQTMPIPEAMTAGLIKVSFTTTKRSQEKKSSIGIITVKTTRESVQPYTITAVRDVAAGTDLTQRQASKQGLLDEKHGVFTNNKTGNKMLISEAIDAGLVSVEYQGTSERAVTVSKTYAVRAVVDTSKKATVTFHEAVRRGILNRDTGAFLDTLTGNSMYVGDAIMRGFLKAREIDDPQSLNIDPENRLVIDKTDVIRKKLLHPLGVISAFRKAAKMAGAFAKDT